MSDARSLVPVPAPGTQAITLGAELSELESAALSDRTKAIYEGALRYVYAWLDQHGRICRTVRSPTTYTRASLGRCAHSPSRKLSSSLRHQVHARWSSPLPKVRQSCGARPPRSVQGYSARWAVSVGRDGPGAGVRRMGWGGGMWTLSSRSRSKGSRTFSPCGMRRCSWLCPIACYASPSLRP